MRGTLFLVFLSHPGSTSEVLALCFFACAVSVHFFFLCGLAALFLVCFQFFLEWICSNVQVRARVCGNVVCVIAACQRSAGDRAANGPS